MRLPRDPRRRAALATGAILVLGLLVVGGVLARSGDKERQETALDATPSPSPTPPASATATSAPPQDTATAEPPGTAEPTTRPATPSPPTTAPVPSPEAPRADLCTGTLQETIDAAPDGAVLDLSGCTFNGTARVRKPLTLIGASLNSPSGNNQLTSLSVEADNVTIDGWTFRGGGNVISVVGKTNVRILNNTFRDHSGGVIGLWGAVRSIEIAGNDIVNSRTVKSGIVGGRASEGSNPCPVVGRNVTIRDNHGDQGAGNLGWFGIELKCFEDVLIERNSLRGGSVLISLPDSNRVTVRYNKLDLTGSPYWGVEVPRAHNVTIERNTVFGDGPMNDTAFSANSGSQGLVVRFNIVSNVRTLVDGPLGAIVTDNCIVSVTYITQFGEPEASTIERNAIC